VHLVSGHPPTANSALYITSKIQYVTETPEEVSTAVAAAGGEALPIPSEGVLATIASAVKDFGNPPEAWD
jgi:hypothetical protein